MDNHIKPAIGRIPLGKLTTLDLQGFYKKLLDVGKVERVESKRQSKGFSPKTVRNLYQVISSALRLAVQQKTDFPELHRRLRPAQSRTSGDAHPDGRPTGGFLPRGEGRRGVCTALLPGTGYRPAPGRTAGPSLGGCGLGAEGDRRPKRPTRKSWRGQRLCVPIHQGGPVSPDSVPHILRRVLNGRVCRKSGSRTCVISSPP
ncbi:hypothetical protein [Anaerotruncus colihominis]|uniref:hypothetical protein n=1 Tax=Bacteria TaxID=2 RepID=UPI0034E49205